MRRKKMKLSLEGHSVGTPKNRGRPKGKRGRKCNATCSTKETQCEENANAQSETPKNVSEVPVFVDRSQTGPLSWDGSLRAVRVIEGMPIYDGSANQLLPVHHENTIKQEVFLKEEDFDANSSACCNEREILPETEGVAALSDSWSQTWESSFASPRAEELRGTSLCRCSDDGIVDKSDWRYVLVSRILEDLRSGRQTTAEDYHTHINNLMGQTCQPSNVQTVYSTGSPFATVPKLEHAVLTESGAGDDGFICDSAATSKGFYCNVSGSFDLSVVLSDLIAFMHAKGLEFSIRPDRCAVAGRLVENFFFCNVSSNVDKLALMDDLYKHMTKNGWDVVMASGVLGNSKVSIEYSVDVEPKAAGVCNDLTDSNTPERLADKEHGGTNETNVSTIMIETIMTIDQDKCHDITDSSESSGFHEQQSTSSAFPNMLDDVRGNLASCCTSSSDKGEETSAQTTENERRLSPRSVADSNVDRIPKQRGTDPINLQNGCASKGTDDDTGTRKELQLKIPTRADAEDRHVAGSETRGSRSVAQQGCKNGGDVQGQESMPQHDSVLPSAELIGQKEEGKRKSDNIESVKLSSTLLDSTVQFLLKFMQSKGS